MLLTIHNHIIQTTQTLKKAQLCMYLTSTWNKLSYTCDFKRVFTYDNCDTLLLTEHGYGRKDHA